MIVERIRKLNIDKRPIFTGIYGHSYGQEYFVEDNLCKYNLWHELYRYLRSEGYTTVFYNTDFNFFSYEENQLETLFLTKPDNKSVGRSTNIIGRFVAPIASPNGHNRRRGIRLGVNREVERGNTLVENTTENITAQTTNPTELVSHHPGVVLVANTETDHFYQWKSNVNVMDRILNFTRVNPGHKLAVVFTMPSAISFGPEEDSAITHLQAKYSQQRQAGSFFRLIVCYDFKDATALREAFRYGGNFFFNNWFQNQMFPNFREERPDVQRPSDALFYVGKIGKDEVANVLKRRRIMEGLQHTLVPIPFDELCAQISKRFRVKSTDSNEEKEIVTVMDLMELPKEVLEAKFLEIGKKLAMEFSEDTLKDALSTIHGQQDNLDVVVDKVVTWVNSPDATKRPLVLMFAGPSGTGKTYTAETIQKSLENHDFGFLELDMNEYTSEMDSQKLLGSAPGYVGSDQESPIFDAAKKNDKLVILFDEIEKSHPIIFKNLMTLMDKGYLGNGRGERIDFRQSIIIFTTNLAMDILIEQKAQMVKANIPINSPDFQKVAKETLHYNGIPTEICGRIACLLVYNPLSTDIVARITIEEIRKKGKDYGIQINNISQTILKEVATHVVNSPEGARPIRNQVESLLAKKFQVFLKGVSPQKETSNILSAGNYIEAEIDNNIEVVASTGTFKSTEEIISQYPDLTMVSKILNFDNNNLKSLLNKVIGQDDNIKVITDKIGVWIKKRKKERPIVFMLAGTSGTGKTYTAKNIQKSLSSYNYKFVRIDMNEYHSEADSWKLIGSSTGYSGSTDDSPLFAAHKQSDKLVILFDEIEKAHPSLFTTIMGLMDEGMLANGRGQRFNFKNSIIVFTTNLAMDRLKEAKMALYDAGINATDMQFQTTTKEILKQSGLRTEICGRINWLLVYNTFNIKQTAQIALDQIREKGKEYDININLVNPELILSIAERCAGHNEGARPIRTEVENLIEPVLQAAYEDGNYNVNKLYDIDNHLKLVKSKSNVVVSIDEIIPSNLLGTPEMPEKTRQSESAQPINEITLSSVLCFSDGYSYDDYSKAMGLLVLDGGKAEATGFLISSNGYVLTCEHCTQSERIVFVKDDNKKEYNASVVYRNHSADIAILKIDADGMPYLQITDSMKPLKVGAEVIILGYPTGTGISHNVSAFEGKVSNRENKPGAHTYQTDAIATHGSSGGAFISKQDGLVYGLLAGGYQEANINIATDIRNLLQATDFTINFL